MDKFLYNAYRWFGYTINVEGNTYPARIKRLWLTMHMADGCEDKTWARRGCIADHEFKRIMGE